MPSKYFWDLEKIKVGLENFYKINGRYPTCHEFDAAPGLPSSRQVQRRFGGMVEMRKSLGLSGPTDFTKGDHSSKRASTIGARAHKNEKMVYDYLVERFGAEFVHREYFFTDDKRTRTDFYVYTKDGNFSIDVFYPKDRFSLAGCIRSKMMTYGSKLMLKYPVIFLMMNDDISRETVEKIVGNKKIKLNSYQKVFTFDQLKEFCKGKKRLTIRD